MSDSGGYIYDPDGIDLSTIKILKEVERKRIIEYRDKHPDAEYVDEPSAIWNIKCDIALPSAIQNELDGGSAKALVENGCYAVGEGANMPSTPEAVKIFLENKILYGRESRELLAELQYQL